MHYFVLHYPTKHKTIHQLVLKNIHSLKPYLCRYFPILSINFLHLLRSTACSLFSTRAQQSFTTSLPQVFFSLFKPFKSISTYPPHMFKVSALIIHTQKAHFCLLQKINISQFFDNTHTRLTAFFPGLLGWAGTRKVKPIWILLKQETVSGSGISWAICKSAPRSRQITTAATHHSVFYRPDALPAAQPTASKHWRLGVYI